MADTRPQRGPEHRTVLFLVCAAVFISYIDRTAISVGAIAMQAQFGWDEGDKGLVLAAFFAGYLLLQIPAGALSVRFGGRKVLGAGVLLWSLFTVLTPAAAILSLPALLAARVGLGLGEASVFPSSINMIGRWVPASMRTRAVAMMVSTLLLATVFALLATGWLIHLYGWAMPFYAFGALGFIWAAVWFARVREGYGIAPTAAATPTPGEIPWGRLLRLPALWAIICAHFCNNWVLFLELAWLPSYFKSVHSVSLTNAGLLSAIPWFIGFMSGIAVGHMADRLLSSGRRASAVRKSLQTVSLLGPAMAMLLLPSVDTAGAALLLICFTTATMAFAGSGFASNCFDIAPRHASVIWGLSNTVAALPGVIGVYITGWLVQRTGHYAAPFYLTAAVTITGALVFIRFASGERQID